MDGDLVAAIAGAREIEQRLEDFKTSGDGRGRIRRHELVAAYLADLQRCADAGEVDPKTVVRYQSALAYYLGFVGQSAIEARYPLASRNDRAFALEFAAYLTQLQGAPNGHAHSRLRRMVSTQFVESVVNGMLLWAADPQRGALLPDGFRNPFAGRCRKSTDVATDLFSPPDISCDMAIQFIAECDAFQLPVFALLVLYGPRPSEMCYLFRENMTDGWLHVCCDPALGYMTKGRRNKRLPLVEGLPLPNSPCGGTGGLLFLRRSVLEGSEPAPLLGASLEALRQAFAERCRRERRLSAADRLRIRDLVLRDAGGLTYDHVEQEFKRIARKLDWPRAATLKDCRHLCNMLRQNAGMPEFYRRYLLGHSPGKTALVSYSHLNELRERYEEAVDRTLRPLVDSVLRRAVELGFPG